MRDHNMKRRVLGIAALLFAVCMTVTAGNNAGSSQPTPLQIKQKGTYIVLFSQRGINASKWDKLWLSEVAKYVGQDKAQETVDYLKSTVGGSVIGSEATAKYGDYTNDNTDFSGKFQFDCHFRNGLVKLIFNGKNITGLDANGRKVFSHNYSEVGYNKVFDGHEYKSDDGNKDEFTYFVSLSDNPIDTYHIEFRYGSDLTQLTEYRTGKYAYWMCAGVREGNDADCEGAIKLFVKENLSKKSK